ncbi:MAG: Gfo/Idh/MocA family oxidoreductase [Nibricoccus sp.]
MIETTQPVISEAKTQLRRPRLGFVGIGWIGKNRLEAVQRSGLAEIVAIYDPLLREELSSISPAPERVLSFESLLERDLDGVVIATPSALHAQQAIAALSAGRAVFCQKPLARTAAETRAVVSAAEAADRLLSVDLSYRFTTGIAKIRQLIEAGELGELHAIEMKFHNAYGPDKAWFYDRKLSGGGCLLDLGIHLVDMALSSFHRPEVNRVSGSLLTGGERWTIDSAKVEDYAAAQITLQSGAVIQLACSWRAHAGCEADIEATFFGSKGGACFRNVNGSFYDFRAEHFLSDRSRRVLAEPPDDWGGRAILDWVQRLVHSPRYSSNIEMSVTAAEVIDAIYDSAR